MAVPRRYRRTTSTLGRKHALERLGRYRPTLDEARARKPELRPTSDWPTTGLGVVTRSDIHVLRIIGALDPEYGGTSEASVRECIAAQQSGVRNTFIFGVDTASRDTTRSTQERLVSEGVRVRPFRVSPLPAAYARRWGLSLSMCFWIARHLRSFDVVHLHQTWGLPQVVALVVAALARRPCVLTPHESLTAYDVEREKQLVKRCLKRLYLRRASLILLASSLEADDSVGAQHRAKSKVLPHPLEHMPHNGRTRGDGEVTSPEAPLNVGFLGRLHPKKNVHLLIQAIGAVERDVHLRVAGTGPEAYEARLVRHAHAAGVADRVAWVGFVQRDDRHRFFADVDLLALVSEYECFGVAAAEAMSDGVAVLVSERTGIAPMVAKHACGFVVAPDVASIVEALRVATADRELLARLAGRGPGAVEQELSMEAYGTSVRRSYEALIERGRPSVTRFKG